MSALFASGRIVDCIVGLMLVELLVLIIVRIKTLKGLPPLEILTSLGAGAALLFALRAALSGAPWQGVAMWLAIALLAHLGDMALRWTAARTR